MLRVVLGRHVMALILMMSGAAYAATTNDMQTALHTCQTEFADDASRRLVCFDKVAEQYAAVQVTTPVLSPKQEKLVKSVDSQTTYLARKWHLNPDDELHFTDLETHQLNYVVGTYSNNPNQVPTSPSRPNTQDRDLNNNDLHFQISLKTQLMNLSDWLPENNWVHSARLWGAYTQQSFWQVYSESQSRPMRDHNYSPELILSLGLNKPGEEKKSVVLPDMVNIGLLHESNGRSEPLSRSWSRIYLQGGWQLNDRYSLLVRPWWRIPESKADDDNPDIAKYMGYGDMVLRWDNEAQNTAASMTLRNNMRSDNKGYVKFDVQYKPLKSESVRFYAMIASGYGVSLLDYNQAQTMLGLGFAIGE
jgi:phospholipase A1/A2